MLVAISVCHGAAVDMPEWLMKLPMASVLEDDELGVEVDDGVVVLWRRLPVTSAPPLSRSD